MSKQVLNRAEAEYSIQHFSEMSADSWHSIIQLREAVFVVEQECIYQDADDKDRAAWHVAYWEDKSCIACSRVLPPGISYPEHSSIGRVATALSVRGLGMGKLVMEKSIEQAKALFPDKDIKISAQVQALAFYEKLGFQVVSEVYQEDGIPHRAMVLKVGG